MIEIESLLAGVIVALTVTAGIFFLKFWRDTRDGFFLAFAISFIIEGLNRCAIVFLPRPNEGSPWIYLVRLFSFLLILAAILRKNYGSKS